MKIALVHDYLREYGGAERVLEAIHEIWPEAPLYTSFVDWPSFAKAPAGKVELFKSWDIRTSWVQDNWLVKKFHSPLRFLAPKIWASFDLSEYDVVISSSGWFMCRGVNVGSGLGRLMMRGAKVDSSSNPSVDYFALRSQKNLDPSSISFLTDHTVNGKEKVNPDKIFSLPAQSNGPLHICYIHHPPRNLYGYATGSNLQKYWPVRVYATIINFFLRQYDYNTAQKVDYFIANSQETARRVKKFYRRESMVIYPPVEVNPKFQAPNPKQIPNSKFSAKGGPASGWKIQKKDYFLSVGRLTYSKRVDVAIAAANKLMLPLKIVGSGKEEAYLRSIAGPTIEFMGSVSDSELAELYEGAKALIFCALDEDFGMVPVEAMAVGTPVIGLAQGGVVESVIDGKTGVLFNKPTATALVSAIQYFNNIYYHSNWERNCRQQAEKFGKERFKRELWEFVNNVAK